MKPNQKTYMVTSRRKHRELGKIVLRYLNDGYRRSGKVCDIGGGYSVQPMVKVE